MTIIGLDLSLRAPGWFKREPSGAIEHGTYYPKQKTGLSRIHEIANFCRQLIPSYSDKAETLVVIEGFANGARGPAVPEIFGLGYIIRYSFWYRQIRYVEVAPRALKKFATGSGKSEKNIVIREVYKRWKVDATDDNEADAYVLGRIGMHLAQIAPSEELTAFQRDVLKGIKY